MKRIKLLFVILVYIYACQSLRKGSKSDQTEDFDHFYHEFHTDSVFQLKRIIFPLEGMRYDNGEEGKWSKKNWQQKRNTIYDVDTNLYKTEFIRSDSLVFERIYIPNSGFDFQCKYKLIEGKWYLVYCLDQNL